MRPSFLGLATLVVACSVRSPSIVESGPAIVPAVPESAPAAAPPRSAEPKEPVEPVEPSPLAVVAAREGSMELLLSSGVPTVTMESEPVPLRQGRPSRRPGADEGLAKELVTSLDYAPTIAMAGDIDTPGGAWLTTARHADRGASTYTVYQRTAHGWRSLDLRKGLLVGYYSAYVERDGAQLALRVWAADSGQDHFATDDMGSKATAYRKAVERALTKARPAWVRLAGAKTQRPQIPRGARPLTAVTTDDGSLMALAADSADSWPRSVLVWSPGSTTASSVALPDLPDASLHDPRVSSAGGWALAAAWYRGEDAETHSYLAVGRGTSWERVEVALPGLPEDSTAYIQGMTRTTEGELWIAVGNRWDQVLGARPLWRKPAEGPWRPVPLPKVDPGLFARGKSWVHAPFDVGGWVQIERGSVYTSSAIPTGLAWSEGAVWAAIEIDDAYDGDELPFPIPRSLLLTTGSVTEPPVVLPSALEVQLIGNNRRQGSAKPGSSGCEEVALLLGLPSQSEVDRIATALVTPAADGESAQVELVYVGRLDGQEVLTASAHTWGADEALELSQWVAERGGVTPTLSCRIPHMVRPLRWP